MTNNKIKTANDLRDDILDLIITELQAGRQDFRKELKELEKKLEELNAKLAKLQLEDKND